MSPITVTLWGGDLFPLSARGKRAPSAIASFATRFNSILEHLRAAAPNAEIIVTGAWNPEADRLAQVEPLYRSVDAAIRHAATASRMRVANMFAALNGPGNVSAQKARLCSITFYCSAKGDPHPNDAGYRAMAAAFIGASDYPQKPEARLPFRTTDRPPAGWPIHLGPASARGLPNAGPPPCRANVRKPPRGRGT